MNLTLPPLALTLLLVGFSAGAQTPTVAGTSLPRIIPPSPTAAALMKYVETPVGTYTGVPNISIPLYEIKVRDITVPISLSYHAGGNRVDEEASWVGLGWSLNAGGAITCTVRGKEDFTNFWLYPSPMPVYGYKYTEDCEASASLQTYGNKNAANQKTYDYKDDTYAASDWDLDTYSFNFLSYSGQYVFEHCFAPGKLPRLVPRLLSQQKMRIEYPQPGVPGSAHRLTTPDGTVYEFGMNGAGQFVASEQTTVNEESSRHFSTLYLTKITSPLGEVVTFDYDNTAPAVYPVRSFSYVQNVREGGCDPSAVRIDGGMYISTQIVSVYLTRINFKTGYVLFKRDPVERADLHGGQRLQTIQVFETGNATPIREFALGASYTQSPSESYSATYSYDALDHQYAAKRLQLDQLTERSNGLAKPPYRFSYNSTPLPYKTSYQRDHWGFFNGQHDNASLIPSYEGYADGYSTEYLSVKGANREPNPTTVAAGVLETIQYPTGGTTHFQYEANEYGNLQPDEYYSTTHQTVQAADTAQIGTYRPSAPVPFTIKSDHSHVQVSLQFQAYNPGASSNFDPTRTYIIIRRVDGTWSPSYGKQVYNYADYVPANSRGGIGSDDIFLDQGDYILTATAYASTPGQFVLVRGSVSWTEKIKNVYKKVGPGLRVTKITDNDVLNPANTLVREYNYDATVEDNGPHLSSTGVLMNRPIYSRYKEKHYVIPSPCGDPTLCPEQYGLCRAFQLCSYSNMNLQASAQGSLIGYSRVEERRGSQASGGKTVYEYINSPDISYLDHPAPGLPQTANPFNGYLAKQTVYAVQGASFSKRSETALDYAQAVNQPDSLGAISGVVKELDKADYYYYPNSFFLLWCVMPVHTYLLRSQWIYPTKRTERLYEPQDETKYHETTTTYAYDNPVHMQVTRTETKRSDGTTLLTHTTYPADYPQVTSGPLAAMRSDAVYQHSLPVESVTQVYAAGQTAAEAKVVSGTYTEYSKPTGTSRYLPTTISTLELAQPRMGLDAAAPALPPTGRYVLKQQLTYDPGTANLMQARRAHDVATAYLWGYNYTLPIAQIKNASASQVQAALSAANIDLNKALTDSDLRTYFAQLRLRLPQAQVTSFTHRPLIGLTSQTDPTGRTVTYEYDDLGRLVRTRDEQGRILSQQQYHYAGK